MAVIQVWKTQQGGFRMNYSPRTRLLLEATWMLVSILLLVIGWINYHPENGGWSLLLIIFGACFLLYSLGSAIFYWRFHRKRPTKQ
jgi:hypothetical protein